MTRRSLAIDLGLAVLTFGLTIAMLSARGLGTPHPITRDADAVSLVLAMVSTLPLVAMRLAPVTVFAVTAAASLLLLALDYGFDTPFGAAVAAYAVAQTYGGDPRPVRRRAAGLMIASFVPVAIVLIMVDRAIQVEEMLPGLLVWTLIFVGVWIAADRTRLRRERIAELEEHARRVEREAEHERRVVAAEERTRIARELHDSAGHAINVILMQAGAARLLHERDPAGSRQAIATIEQVARRTIGEIDTMVRALREDDSGEPPPADPAAIEELVERHRADGLAVTADLHGPRRTLPHSVAWAAYRILQESLTNAARHGGGSAEVAVRFEPAALDITVTNPVNGAAGGTGAAPPGGHGIVGMRERATLLGGTLAADARGGMFRLHARLPHPGAAP